MKIQRYYFDHERGYERKKDDGDYVKYSDLQELIDAAPVVWGNNAGEVWCISRMLEDYKKARLMFIEELKQEPCEHQPRISHLSLYNTVCAKCGIQLEVVSWKPKGGA